MGKKKGGLCQTKPETAKDIVESFGCFLSYLIRSYVFEAKVRTRDEQKKYQKKVMDMCRTKIEERLQYSKNETPILDIVYNFFGSARMVDENLIEAVIDLDEDKKYEITLGYIHERGKIIRGNQSSITTIKFQNRKLQTRQDAIAVQESGKIFSIWTPPEIKTPRFGK